MSVTDLFQTERTSPHRLLLASAGTGKTYQLANHFAGLLAAGVAPERILATTFTRKAAGEILDRVLARLGEAATEGEQGARAREDFARSAKSVDPGIGGSMSAAHCRSTLARLLRAIDRFQVRTLDSFFVGLARLFAMELEIAPTWRMADDAVQRAVVLEGVARVIEELDFDEQLTLLRGIATSVAGRDASGALASAITAADELARIAEDGAWDGVPPMQWPEESEVEEARRVVLEARPPTTKTGTPDKLWSKALEVVREVVLLDPLDPAFGEMTPGLLVKAVEGKEQFNRKPIPEPLGDALRVFGWLQAAAGIAQIVARNRANARLLTAYEDVDRALRSELGIYRFSDFSRALLLGPAATDSDLWLSDLAYRLDGRLDHVLLDEFQDTAPSQWRLLEPVANEVVSGGEGSAGAPRTLFCVGDVKQSIYGWRGAEPALLGRMGERMPMLDVESLTVSWRSSQIVLDTVNRVFEGVAGRACLAGEARDAPRAAAEEWEAGFARHETAEPLRDVLGGEARLWQSRAKEDGESEGAPASELAVETVAAIAAAHPSASIAVLVRAKAEIPRIRFLLGERGLEASDEGGNPLTDSLGVTWILALLQLADHPHDGVARLQVARSPFAREFGLDLGTVETDRGREDAERIARRVREDLLHRGYGAFCAVRAESLGAEASDWDARRLEQLVDLALTYDARATLRPIDFVDLVRSQRVPDPTASRIKVMTIHASKGLEFDAVVLPELGRSIRLTPVGVLSRSASETEPPNLLSVVPKKSLALQHGVLGEVFESAEKRAMTDALSALYVAMTRAKHCLELIVPPPPKRESNPVALRPANLVRPALEEKEPDAKAVREGEPVMLWEHPHSSDGWGAGSSGAEAMYVPEPNLELAPEPARKAELTPSTIDGGAVSPADGTAKRLGTLVHALFEGVEWSEGESRTDDELRAVCARVDRGPGAPVDEAITRFRAALASDAGREVFAKPAGACRVLNERSFDVETTDADPDAFRIRGAIDRLVLWTSEGSIVRAEIVDFKVVAAATEQDVVDASRAQLDAYRRAIRQLFGLDDAAMTVSILWLPGDSTARHISV